MFEPLVAIFLCWVHTLSVRNIQKIVNQMMKCLWLICNVCPLLYIFNSIKSEKTTWKYCSFGMLCYVQIINGELKTLIDTVPMHWKLFYDLEIR